jgi:hypothetical protein
MAVGRGVHWRGTSKLGPKLPITMLVVIGVVAATAIFLRLWSGDTGITRAPNEPGGNSSAAGPTFGDGIQERTAGGGGEAATSRRAGAGRRASSSAHKLHKNLAAGYSFRYPADWDLETQQTVSKLTSPDRHFVISFGLGPKGGLPVAYDEFVALLDEAYTNLVVNKVNATHVGGSVGVVARGAATASEGVRIRFLATVIERPGNRRAIGALAATDMKSAKFPPTVREILSSLRPL